MPLTLNDLQVAQATSLTTAYKTAANREAAKVAALVALYYQQRVDPASASSVERWLDIMIPRLISTSDTQAQRAAAYFAAIRRLELGASAPVFRAEPAVGQIDEGVRKSLLAIGPFDYQNKMKEIERTANLSEQQRRAMILEAKQVTAKKIAAATVRHAQAGGRETIHRASGEDPVALGYIRVTRTDPCFFCAMLASRGLSYRAFKEDSFDLSDARFTGDGDAKVHDGCGCSLKAVYATNDPLVARTEKFAEMWSMWGAGGGDAALRFRRGYEHFQRTGEYLTYDEVSRSPRAA